MSVTHFYENYIIQWANKNKRARSFFSLSNMADLESYVCYWVSEKVSGHWLPAKKGKGNRRAARNINAIVTHFYECGTSSNGVEQAVEGRLNDRK